MLSQIVPDHGKITHCCTRFCKHTHTWASKSKSPLTLTTCLALSFCATTVDAYFAGLSQYGCAVTFPLAVPRPIYRKVFQRNGHFTMARIAIRAHQSHKLTFRPSKGGWRCTPRRRCKCSRLEHASIGHTPRKTLLDDRNRSELKIDRSRAWSFRRRSLSSMPCWQTHFPAQCKSRARSHPSP